MDIFFDNMIFSNNFVSQIKIVSEPPLKVVRKFISKVLSGADSAAQLFHSRPRGGVCCIVIIAFVALSLLTAPTEALYIAMWLWGSAPAARHHNAFSPLLIDRCEEMLTFLHCVYF